VPPPRLLQLPPCPVPPLLLPPLLPLLPLLPSTSLLLVTTASPTMCAAACSRVAPLASRAVVVPCSAPCAAVAPGSAPCTAMGPGSAA
jgi:hypothetical protein